MLTVVKKTEQELLSWLATEEGFITAFGRFEDQPINLEPYQQAFVRNKSRFRWVNKSRRVGYSFLFAAEALARCHLRDHQTSVFVSYNLSDATEKILVARQMYEDLPLAYRKKLVNDSKTELAFESNGAKKYVTRILSVPSKAPRGKGGDLYLDELAHYLDDREVYRGSTALISRSMGRQLTGCSTPLGRRGIFWEIATEEIRPYPHHWRQVVPWWLCSFFCSNAAAAAKRARSMMTEEAVRQFGSPPLIEQFDSLPLEDFEQEFCGIFVDESYSYYPYDLILPNTSDELTLAIDAAEMPVPKGRLVAGFDVGRANDRSELAVFEETEGRFVCRMLRTFTQMPFQEQEAQLRRLLDSLPFARFSIDRTGIGMNLAENLARDYPNVRPEAFTNESKERWATDFKILLQKRDVVMPRTRDVIAQVHSIKRTVLPSGRVQFDAEKTAKGHADKFWALALACQKERTFGHAPMEICARIVGGESRGYNSSLGPRLPATSPADWVIVDPWADHAGALEALDRALAALNAELVRDDSGRCVMAGDYFAVRSPQMGPEFLRAALAQKGCVRRVIR